MRKILIIGLILVFMSSSINVFSVTVELKNGDKIVGEIIRKGRKSIVIRAENGTMEYPIRRSRIRRIRESRPEEIKKPKEKAKPKEKSLWQKIADGFKSQIEKFKSKLAKPSEGNIKKDKKKKGYSPLKEKQDAMELMNEID